MFYDEKLKTYYYDSMVELSKSYIVLAEKGYKLDAVYSNCGLTGEGFILLVLTIKKKYERMDYRQLMFCFRNKEVRKNED